MRVKSCEYLLQMNNWRRHNLGTMALILLLTRLTKTISLIDYALGTDSEKGDDYNLQVLIEEQSMVAVAQKLHTEEATLLSDSFLEQIKGIGGKNSQPEIAFCKTR